MRFSRTLFGLIVVLIGAVLLLDNLDISGSDIPGDYWPVILIVLGLAGWIGKSLLPGLGSMVLMSLGGILLAQNLVDDKSFVDFWPVLAIAVGVSILFGQRHGKRHKGRFIMGFHGGGNRWKNRRRCHTNNDSDEYFSGEARQFGGEYTGSTARVKLGSERMDLSLATLPAEGATLSLDVTLGEYKIRVPDDWKLDIQADITMAEISDNRRPIEGDRTGPTLTVGGRVFMGGVEISS